MALSTYTELLAAVATWTNRNDLTDAIPDFVTLCEAELNQRLRTPRNEAMETAFALTGRYTALPNDFAEIRRVFLNYGSERIELPPIPQVGRVSETGIPTAYNVVDNTLEVTPVSTAYTVELTYWTKVPALASNNTNAILTNYPGVYLYGSCLQAGLYLEDQAMIGKFAPAFEAALRTANGTRFRQMGTGLQVRVS